MITLSPEIHNAIENTDRHEFGEMRNVTQAPVVREVPIDPFAGLIDSNTEGEEGAK